MNPPLTVSVILKFQIPAKIEVSEAFRISFPALPVTSKVLLCYQNFVCPVQLIPQRAGNLVVSPQVYFLRYHEELVTRKNGLISYKALQRNGLKLLGVSFEKRAFKVVPVVKNC